MNMKLKKLLDDIQKTEDKIAGGCKKSCVFGK